MTGRHRDVKPMTGKWLPPALLVFVLFVLCGCDGGSGPSSRVGMTPRERTEADLLAELNRNFENPQVHYELARLHHKSQNWEKADYYYNLSLEFDPAFKPAQAGWVKMFVDRGDPSKAEQFASGYLRQAAISVTETLRLADAFEQVGLDEYALRALKQAIDVAPDSAEANKQIGFYYLRKGDTATAKPYLVRSFQLNSKQPDVAGELGRLGVVVEAPGEPAGRIEKPK